MPHVALAQGGLRVAERRLRGCDASRRYCLGMAQGGLSVAERRLRGRNAGRRLRLGMTQGGLSVAERRLRSRDAGRRYRLGIRQAVWSLVSVVCETVMLVADWVCVVARLVLGIGKPGLRGLHTRI